MNRYWHPKLLKVPLLRDDFDQVAADALVEISTIFNPRHPGKDEVVAILEKAC